MEWINQYLDSQDQFSRRRDRCAERIKEARPTIWSALYEDISRCLGPFQARRPGALELGGFAASSDVWLIRRIERPPYEVEVHLQASAILIQHDFRVSSIMTSGDICSILVDFRCDQEEYPCLEIDGERVDVHQVSRRILEPIVSGKRRV
jgi:hypothetical protein